MKAVRLLVPLCAAVLLWGPGRAARGEELPAAAKEVLSVFEKDAAEVHKKAEAEAKKVREKTAVELKLLQDKFCKEAKLDEAVAIRDQIRQMNGGAPNRNAAALPSGAREVLDAHEKEIAEIHKKAVAELKKIGEKAAEELKVIQDRFCKDAKLDEAVAVRDLRRNLHLGGAKVLPDPGYVNNGPRDIGKVFYYEIVANANGSTYGTDVYTTGSHLGTTAIHCGILRPGQKGVVKVTILPGQAGYSASTRHGVTSYAYGHYGVSFKVERAYWVLGALPKVGAEVQPDPGTLTTYRGQVGKSFLFEVTGSNTGSAYGTDIYTDDSTLATAAVHAGVLAAGQKGVVKVTVLDGQANYPSTTRNGVTSSSWGSWTASYRVEAVKK